MFTNRYVNKTKQNKTILPALFIAAENKINVHREVNGYKSVAVDYYSAIKSKELLINMIKWMNLKKLTFGQKRTENKIMR